MQRPSELMPYEVDDLPDYQVEVRIRNARFLRMMHRAGIFTIAELCRRIGQPNAMSRVGDLINLKLSPLNARGEYRPIVNKIADALFCLPDDLFTEKQRHNFMVSNRFLVEVAEVEIEERLARLENRSAEQLIDEQDFRKGIQTMLDGAGLTPRQRFVLERRFPQDGSLERTLQQVGDELEVSKERIRLIEHQALQKLRRMRSAKHVMPWLSHEAQELVKRQASAVEYDRRGEEQKEGD